MCGIAGIFIPEGENSGTLLNMISNMCAAQKFRGPDESGIWSDSYAGLGCVRLSIVGDNQKGTQPIKDKWGGYTIFNGEIYDYKEVFLNLKENFHRGVSDGLALASLLATKGPRALRDISGMYAGIRYNPQKKELTLVRSPFGKKPLYIKLIKNGWGFASTLNALKKISEKFQIRSNGIYEYLIFRSIGGYQSIFEGIEQLTPGSWMTITRHGQV